MLQIDPIRAYPTEFDNEQAKPFFDAPKNTESPPIPSVALLLNRLHDANTHLYDTPQLLPARLVDESVLLAQLVAQGETNRWKQFQGLVATATREANLSTETDPPHLSWPESYLQIFIEKKHLEPRRFEKADLTTEELVTDTESDSYVEYRRYVKQTELEYAVESIRAAALLELLRPAAENQDSKTVSFQTLLRAIMNTAECEPVTHQTSGSKVTQAQNTLEAGIRQTGEMRKKLLNLALDTATTALDSLPEGPNPERAAAYLVAATSVHDLASQPGSFLPRLAEHEARDFRVRALEIASYWVTQAADIYRAAFGGSVGDITPHSLAKITKKIALIKESEKFINDAFWFEGIYRNDHLEAASKLDHKVRSIGQGAVILALKQPRPNEQ